MADSPDVPKPPVDADWRCPECGNGREMLKYEFVPEVPGTALWRCDVCDRIEQGQ